MKKIINSFLLGSLILSSNLYAFNYNQNNVNYIRIKKIKVLSSNINNIYLYSLNNFKNYGGNAFSYQNNIGILNKNKLKEIYKLPDNIFNNVFNNKSFNFELLKDKNGNYYFKVINLNLKTIQYKDLSKYLLNWTFKDKNIIIPIPVFYNKIIAFNNTIKQQISEKPINNHSKLWFQPNKLNGFNIYSFFNNKWNRVGYVIFDTTNYQINYEIILPNEKETLKIPKNDIFKTIKVEVNNHYYINYIYDNINKKWIKEDTKNSEFKGETTLEGLINDLYNSENGTIFYVTSKFWRGTKTFKKTILDNGKNVWVDTTNKIYIFDNVIDMLKSKLTTKINIIKDLYNNNIYYGYYYDLLKKYNLHVSISDYFDLENINSNDLSYVQLYDINNGWLLKKYGDIFYNEDKSVILSLNDRKHTKLISNIKNNAKVYMKKNDCNSQTCYDYPYIEKEGDFYTFYYIKNTNHIKNINHLTNIPVYDNILEGQNSNNNKFLYNGKNIYGGISSFNILNKIEKNEQNFYQDKNGRFINTQGLYFPLNYIPNGITPDIPIMTVNKINYLVFDNLEDIVLNIDVPKNETIFINNENKYLIKCNKITNYTLWADNCYKPNYQVTNSDRTKLLRNYNYNSINLTYQSIPYKTLHQDIGGIKYPNNNNFFQWSFIDKLYKNWIVEGKGQISNFIINNFIDAYNVNDSKFGDKDFDDKVIEKYNDFSIDEYYIDKNHILASIKNLNYHKYIDISKSLNISNYKLPDNNIWFKENEIISIPNYFKNNNDKYKTIYGNNIFTNNGNIKTIKNYEEQIITFEGSKFKYLNGTFLITINKTKNKLPANILIGRIIQAKNIEKVVIYETNKVIFDSKNSNLNLNDNLIQDSYNKLSHNFINIYKDKIRLKVYYKPNFKLVLGIYYFIPNIEDNENIIYNSKNKPINIFKANSKNLIFTNLLNSSDKDFGDEIWYKGDK